jgi:hypothetical protein
MEVECSGLLINSHQQMHQNKLFWCICWCELINCTKMHGEYNVKVQDCVYKSLPLAPILSQIIQSIPSHLISLRPIFILCFNVHQGHPSGLLPAGFPTKTLCVPPNTCNMPCPFHVIKAVLGGVLIQ